MYPLISEEILGYVNLSSVQRQLVYHLVSSCIPALYSELFEVLHCCCAEKYTYRVAIRTEVGRNYLSTLITRYFLATLLC